MKKQMWICTVLAVALILAACCTPTKAADINTNEARLRSAERLFEMKIYDQARKILVEVKEADPSNVKARELLGKIDAETMKNGEAKAKPITQKDLDKVIREVDFTEAQLSEVISYLSVKCSVNIVISEKVKWAVEPAMSNVFEPENVSDEFGEIERKNKQDNVFPEPEPKREERDLGGITIRLKNVPLSAVLKYVLQMKGLKYVVDDYAIVIVPQDYDDSGEEMQIETFKIYGGLPGTTPQSGILH